ncbi:Voltage-dependent anion-selective channel protein 1 [Geodia barretti]|uniref:Voltage-dependent anion-selective channel protein 1 n=1 Tax=Geodia barretti TaxID=519541 RepID=A0AA35SMW8_GEOBA|nr:Voltage-dependent anion-selective channel protein 1 [Geodia barretti]
MSNSPPTYGDLGKPARDVFDKGYDFPKVKLSLKTKTESGVEFDTSGSHDLEKSRTTGQLKTKLKFPDYGVTFSESWSTAAEIDSELVYEPSAVAGLKLTLGSALVPTSGFRQARLKAGYRRDYVSLDGDVDLRVNGPIFRGSAVFMYNGWYAGYQMAYNTSNTKLEANNVAGGYQGSDFTVHGSLMNAADCTTSVHHKVSDKTEVGLLTTYNWQTSNVSLGLAGKYVMDDGAVMKTKVNNQGQIGVSYAQDLRSGVKLTLSGMLEGRNVQAGGHKFGLALDFES